MNKYLILFLTIFVSKSYAEVVSAVNWQVPYEQKIKNIIALGDDHEQKPLGAQHSEQLKSYLSQTAKSDKKTFVILEDYKREWDEEVDPQRTLDHINQFASKNNYSIGNARLEQSDIRTHPIIAFSFLFLPDTYEDSIKAIAPACADSSELKDIDDCLRKKYPNFWNQFDQFGEQLKKDNLALEQVTLQSLLQDIDQSIKTLQPLKTVNNSVIQNKFKVLESKRDEFIKYLSTMKLDDPSLSILDIYIGILKKIKSFKRAYEIYERKFDSLQEAIAELGFINSFMEAFDKFDTIVTYIGDRHAAIMHAFIDEFVKKYGGKRSDARIEISYNTQTQELKEPDQFGSMTEEELAVFLKQIE